MFKMKIEKQLNIQDRTLLSGIAEYDAIPDTISVGGNSYKVIGTSYGVKLPYISLEIEKTGNDLEGKEIK